jgi:hypothetical protein
VNSRFIPLLFLALAAVAPFADAQGTIQLANGAGTRFRIGGVIPANYGAGGPVGGTYVFGVFVGTAADTLASQPILPLATNSSIGGLINGPSAGAYPIPGHPAGATVFIQIRMWESRFATWEDGRQGGLAGETAVLPFVLGPESLAPGTVIWSATDPTKFQAIAILIPEPSVVGLLGLGLGSWLLSLRRK